MSFLKLHRRSLLFLAMLLLLAACAQAPRPSNVVPTITVEASPLPVSSATPLPSPIPSPTRGTPPLHYTSRILLQGHGRPDDIAFDAQGRLLFSDEFAGTIRRLNADGSLTTLLVDPAGPEGLVVRPDGTLIFAEQDTNSIKALAPGASTPTLLRALPGRHQELNCKHGVDGIAFDATTNTLIVPDSSTGVVYRMSLDGKTLTPLASNIVRPVGAGVDSQGNIYIADECGNAVWHIAPSGKTTRFGGFGMPDDVVPDDYGNLLVIDLLPAIHALLRLNLTTGKQETLARQDFIEPQGLVIDQKGDIYVSDDYANLIEEFVPV